MFIKSITTPFLQIVFSVLGTIALAMVLLFPCAVLSLFAQTSLVISTLPQLESCKSAAYSGVKLHTQKLE